MVVLSTHLLGTTRTLTRCSESEGFLTYALEQPITDPWPTPGPDANISVAVRHSVGYSSSIWKKALSIVPSVPNRIPASPAACFQVMW